MALNGFGMTAVLTCELAVGLFAVEVFVQQLFGIRQFWGRQVLMAGRTFISLPTVFATVLD